MGTPFFSIIVVSLNAAESIGGTIFSVIEQSCGDFEVIVKDGLSTDGTPDRVPADGRIQVIRQADRSVYEAMNQAVGYAKGRYLLFLNCGDGFADAGVLERVRAFCEARGLSGEEIVYGDYRKDGRLFRQDPHADGKHFIREGFCHQSVFFGRTLLERYGAYDTSFRICADYELMTRCFARGVPFFHIDIPVCVYQGGGISEKPENLDMVRREGNTVRKRYFSLWARAAYQAERIRKRLFRALWKTSAQG